MTDRTIIGECEHLALLHRHEANLWEAMARCVGLAYHKLDAEQRARVMELLRRATSAADNGRGDA